MTHTFLRILLCSLVLGFYSSAVCADNQRKYDLFHLQERYIDRETGHSSTFNTNYAKDANMVRGLGVVTAFLGASLFTISPLPFIGFLTLGKALTASVTAGIGCGMVYYRSKMQSSWTIQPHTESYEASFGYGIKKYFLRPCMCTLHIACVVLLL